MTRRAIESRALAALILGAVCIGFAPLWVRWSETGPVATAFHRLLLALPALALWAARERGTPRAHWSGADRAWVAAAGAFFALDLAAWHLSIRFTTVANATLLANFAPVFVTLGAWVFLKEKANPRFAIGMGFSLGGAWLLTGASLMTNPSHVKGDILGLITAAFYGGYQLCVARLRRHHSPGQILFLSSLACIPLLWAFALGLGERILPVSKNGWLVLLGLAITAQVFGQGLITYGFAHLPASYSSLTLLVQPFVAAVAAWGLLSEAMNARQILGGVVLLAGLVLARHTPHPNRPPRGDSAGAPPPRR